MAKWVKIAETGEVPEGQASAFEVGGTTVALFNVNGEYFAIDDACPHSGGPLSEGDVDENRNVTCPWHEAQFNLKTGDVLCPPAFEGVTSYPITVEGNEIKIQIE